MGAHSPTVDVDESSGPAGQSLDAVFDLLSNQRRRYALACLTDHVEPIALADLAEDIALRENEETVSEIPKEEAQAISTSLYHIHIPKLVDVGAVEYDQDRNRVQVSEPTDLVEQVLSLAADSEEER